MKKIFLFAFLMICALASGQSRHILRADFLMPGIITEHKIFKNNTISGHISLNVPWEQFNDYIYVGLHPYAAVKYNYYLNFNKRQQRGANVDGNSANYLSLGLMWEINAGLDIVNTKKNDSVSNIGGHGFTVPLGFGFQRSFSNRLYYNVLLGARFPLNDINTIRPMINLRLGYTLFNKK